MNDKQPDYSNYEKVDNTVRRYKRPTDCQRDRTQEKRNRRRRNRAARRARAKNQRV